MKRKESIYIAENKRIYFSKKIQNAEYFKIVIG
jgi:hypothetical protein